MLGQQLTAPRQLLDTGEKAVLLLLVLRYGQRQPLSMPCPAGVVRVAAGAHNTAVARLLR